MPLRTIFVDMNAYFASCEQNDFPELRGKPVGVVPIMTDSSCCIAASYEAKRHGVKTGTGVWEARKLCRDIILRHARPQRYVELHHQIVRAVGRCIPVHEVKSIDEMSCKLLGNEKEPARAAEIARQIKKEIRTTVGDALTCSIGIAPNAMLAKVAGDMHKPDGLTLIESHELPTKLYQLELIDFPGIGPRMERRFYRYGITTVRQLMQLTVKQLSMVWGSQIHGERWYYLLRGEEVAEKPTQRRTLGHTHVLPPELRNEKGSHGVMVKLLHKAAARLRTIDYWAGALSLDVGFVNHQRWDMNTAMPHCQDTLSLLRAAGELWALRPKGLTPFQVGITLTHLVPAKMATPSLFNDDRKLGDISRAMDRVNRAFGKNMIQFGTLHGSEETAPTRIGFTHIPKYDPAQI